MSKRSWKPGYNFQDEDDSIRFRAKIEDVEHGEKLSSYFFREIKKNQDESNVKSLKTTAHPEGTQTRKETMTALEDHFKNEFKETNIGGKPDDSWFSGLPTISDSLKEDLEKPICINDLTHALFKELKPSKSPGSDGLTVMFYRSFWAQLSPLLMNSYKEGWQEGDLSNSQKESVIRLIEKKDKSRDTIKGWRQISLLQLDAKLYSKSLARRLKRIVDQVIGPDQLAYIMIYAG